MQMLYNSESYAVVEFDMEVGEASGLTRGGYEIVDKLARKELYLEGLLAEQFKLGVQALIEGSPEPGVEEFDAFIAGYSSLAQQPVLLH